VTQLIVAALATWQAVEIWRHSILFADQRATWEARGGRLAELLLCPWCLSVWVALLCVICVQPHKYAVPLVDIAASWVRGFIWALAVSRLANLGNDLTHSWCRTPRIKVPAQAPGYREESSTLSLEDRALLEHLANAKDGKGSSSIMRDHVEALVRMELTRGLVEKHYDAYNCSHWRITEAGRTALDAYNRSYGHITEAGRTAPAENEE
jgi:hypothetical protein